MDRLIEQKRGIRRKHIPYLIGGIFILWFAGWAIFGNHESALRVDKEKITIEDVSQGIFHDYIRIMGNVEPLTFSQLTVQEGGSVKEILVEEGEMVKAGEVIIRLESKNLELGANLSIELNNTEVLSDAVDAMIEKLDRRSPVSLSLSLRHRR